VTDLLLQLLLPLLFHHLPPQEHIVVIEIVPRRRLHQELFHTAAVSRRFRQLVE